MGPGFSFKCHFNLKSHSFQLIVLKIKDLKGITDLKGFNVYPEQFNWMKFSFTRIKCWKKYYYTRVKGGNGGGVERSIVISIYFLTFEYFNSFYV